jgi:hypothetical protein
MQNYVLLLGILIIGGLAWWVDSRIPHWFRKRGKVIPFSPKYGKDKKPEPESEDEYDSDGFEQRS